MSFLNIYPNSLALVELIILVFMCIINNNKSKVSSVFIKRCKNIL